jgi:cytoskeletal protein CcmA (bactofilin family)
MSIFSSNKDTTPSQASSSATATKSVNTTMPPVQSQPVQNSPTYASSPLTTISEGTTLEGQIKIEGDIKIEGTIKGTVTSKGKVIITTTGKVEGDIICSNGDIAGKVTGKLRIADVLFLKGSAVIDGDINTSKLVIESGVKFNGNCSMGNPVAASKVETPVAKSTVELNA